MRTDWARVALGDIAKVGAGNPAPQDKTLFTDGVHPFFRTADAGRVGVGTIQDSRDYLNESGIDGLRRYPKGTILLPKSGASTFLNHRVILGVSGFVASHLATVIPDADAIDGRFLFYFLITVEAQDLIQDHQYPSLRLSDIKEIELLLPPLPEQKRIVAILDEAFAGIDAAVANTEKNLANARELFESYLEAVFARQGAGWIEQKLGDLASIKHGFAFRSEYFTEDGDYVLLTPGNFFEKGGYRDRGPKQKYYTGDIPDGYILPKGALLVAMTEQAAGLLGSPAIIPEGGRFLHNQRLGLIEPHNEDTWCNDFFFHAFNTRRFREQVHVEASGVKVRHTSPAKLGNVPLRFPSTIDEQRATGAELDDLRQRTSELQSLYEHTLVSLSNLKQSILQKAFSGELTANSVERELASV